MIFDLNNEYREVQLNSQSGNFYFKGGFIEPV